MSENGAGFMRMIKAKFSRSNHETKNRAKMNTIVRKKLCQERFCVNAIVLVYTND